MKRRCGDCQLCCVLLPVSDGQTVRVAETGSEFDMPGTFRKAAGVRCQHQKYGVGCKVHGTDKMPYSCRVWNCRWLVNDDMGDQPRPDRSHLVVDIMPDFVEMEPNAEGRASGMTETINVPVIQVWIDPKYPNAHRDPAFRRYLERQQTAALIRYDSRKAIFLVPPSMTGADWYETVPGTDKIREPHTLNEIAHQLGYELITEATDDQYMHRTTLTKPDGGTISIASNDKAEHSEP
jgi:hypothetical protein